MSKGQDTSKGRSLGQMARQTMRVIGRVSLTIAVIAGAAFAVQIGAAELTRRAEAAPPPDAAALISVSASALRQEDSYTVTRAFVGQVEPQKSVAVSFELPGRLDMIAVDEGDWVKAGDILARQDQALLLSERTRLMATKTATEARLRFALQTVERREALTSTGFNSQAGLDEALAARDELHARVAEINAALHDVAIRLEKSQITAPFDGRVTERLVDGGETLSSGQRVLDLVALHAPQVRIGVPLDLTEDSLSEVEIVIDDIARPARLVTLRPDIDAVTRTRTAIFAVETADQPAFGQTAQLRLQQSVEAHGVWLPTTSLKEGVRGQWTVLTVDAGGIVRSASVEILHAESERVFVRGAFPAGTRLIDEGPQRVTVGQQVTINNAL